MRMRVRAAVVVAVTTALAGGTAPAWADPGGSVSTWSPALAAGEAAGVTRTATGTTLDPGAAHLAPAEGAGPDGALTEGGPDLVPTGLLTLPARRLPRDADRVASTIDGDLPEGTTASVDVRGRRANGGWTEWIPAAPTGDTTGVVDLPEPTDEVQGRLVLTGTTGVAPTVHEITLTASRTGSRHAAEGLTEAAPLRYSVFATREGLVGGTTANGYVIQDRDHFVALPSRRALSPRGTNDYSVRVCAPNGRCAVAPVWDVGPWNTRDDYWNASTQREDWKDLPQGTPQAQAAYRTGYNGGKDQFGRQVVNPAGIDLGDGLFWDALGLNDNSQVTVEYLWTGSIRLSKVVADRATGETAAAGSGAATTGTDGQPGPGSDPDVVPLRSGPSARAPIVGVAVNGSGVPVQCAAPDASGASTGWLRIGDAQYVLAAAVPGAGAVAACPAA